MVLHTLNRFVIFRRRVLGGEKHVCTGVWSCVLDVYKDGCFSFPCDCSFYTWNEYFSPGNKIKSIFVHKRNLVVKENLKKVIHYDTLYKGPRNSEK